ncbi:c-type cytochrome [Aestuariivirga sp.]|uniref:c-type cytochrome n=1 Tax=Aestuariivirga sp. TaxID=2650926 RepID=UPI003BA9C544
MKFLMTSLVGIGFVTLAGAAQAGEVSVARGEQVAITAGCNDCHTAGYPESGGKLDPAAALKGTALGWQGPWGTTYPANLRLLAKEKGSEDAFLEYAKTFQAKPPMPFFNVHAMDDSDIRSLYQYIVSLGDVGEAVPDYVPPGQEPKTPYIVIAPPIMPKG